MTLTLVRLAFAGIRSRRLASALTILLSAAAAATIVLALEVGGTARDPWQRTFEAAHGAHVLANVSSEADARAVARRPGVVERAAPVPIARVAVAGGEEMLHLTAPGRAPRVNAPVPTQGSPPRDGGVVLERSFADALGLRVGDRLRLAAAELPIVGIAISPSQPRYPRRNPGLAWVTRATLEQVVPDRRTWRWVQAVRLRDPAAAPAFAAQLVGVETWQDQRATALAEAQPITLILTTYTIVLLLVVFAVVAILVGARVSEQHREIGLLKAVGLTPRQVGAVFVIESAALGLIAVVIGFSIGVLGAPRLAAASAETMLGSPTTAANPWHLVFAAVPVLLVLVASARSATRRSTRFSVLHAIQSGTATPASPSRLTRALARVSLPVPLALGLTDLLARRHRAIRLAAAIAVTGAAVVFALSMEASLDAQAAGKVSDVPDELPVARLHARRPAARDHADGAGRRRAALGARAHPRLRRAQDHRDDTAADRVKPRERPHRGGARRGGPGDPVGPRALRRRLRDRRREQRGSRARAVVVARPRPGRHRPPGRAGHEPPGPPGDQDPHRRRAPLRVTCRYGRTTGPVCTASSALAGIVLIPFSASSSQPGSTAPPT